MSDTPVPFHKTTPYRIFAVAVIVASLASIAAMLFVPSLADAGGVTAIGAAITFAITTSMLASKQKRAS